MYSWIKEQILNFTASLHFQISYLDVQVFVHCWISNGVTTAWMYQQCKWTEMLNARQIHWLSQVPLPHFPVQSICFKAAKVFLCKAYIQPNGLNHYVALQNIRKKRMHARQSVNMSELCAVYGWHVDVQVQIFSVTSWCLLFLPNFKISHCSLCLC